MNGYIAHTDRDWWDFLSARADLQEINFWRPSSRGFAALAVGEPLFFRLKSPINRIAGFGLLSRFAVLPVWRAWDVFGAANGVADEAGLLARLNHLAVSPTPKAFTSRDAIGCIVLTSWTTIAREHWLAVPSSFSATNPSGARIDLDDGEGRALWEACQSLAGIALPAVEGLPGRPAGDRSLEPPGGRHGRPRLVHPRLGQATFRLAVMDAYDGACAITGERMLAALDVAHIRPWALDGEHVLANGLPLRRDVHRLFDLGYLSVDAAGRVLVSPRVESSGGGDGAYLQLAGLPLRAPRDPRAAPDPELLAWHARTVFRAD
ncbi:MAG TPA: HNH endonuclease [Solirubrobacteraceae bacterium]